MCELRSMSDDVAAEILIGENPEIKLESMLVVSFPLKSSPKFKKVTSYDIFLDTGSESAHMT